MIDGKTKISELYGDYHIKKQIEILEEKISDLKQENLELCDVYDKRNSPKINEYIENTISKNNEYIDACETKILSLIREINEQKLKQEPQEQQDTLTIVKEDWYESSWFWIVVFLLIILCISIPAIVMAVNGVN